MSRAQSLMAARHRAGLLGRDELEAFAVTVWGLMDGIEWSPDTLDAIADALQELFADALADPYGYEDERERAGGA